MQIFNITRDSGANVKTLLRLEKAGFIKIFDVMLENGRENKKVKDKILPVLVWDHARFGECVFSGDDTNYEDIRAIIGSEHIEDAMHLEAHIRNNFDYFVTEDTDFLNKRGNLKQKFNVNIVTPNELVVICQRQ